MISKANVELKVKIVSILFFLVGTNIGASQNYSIKELTFEEGAAYLKLNRYQYDIRMDERDGIITWEGYSDEKHLHMMLLAFNSNDEGIISKSVVDILPPTYNVSNWRYDLPSDFKVFKNYQAGNGEDFFSSNKTIEISSSNMSIFSNGQKYFPYIKTESIIYVPDRHFTDFGDDPKLNFRDINTYDLYNIYQAFAIDLYAYYIDYISKSPYVFDQLHIPEISDVSLIFRPLENSTIAVAIGMDDDSKVEIIVDPDKWKNFNDAKRLYVLYHELGHDIFNLRHGDGGKLMFNYSDKVINWFEFIEEREEYFENVVFKLVDKNMKTRMAVPGDHKDLINEIQKENNFSACPSKNPNILCFYKGTIYTQITLKDNDTAENVDIFFTDILTEKEAIDSMGTQLMSYDDDQIIWKTKYTASVKITNDIYLLQRVVKFDENYYGIQNHYSFDETSRVYQLYDPNKE